VSTEIPAGEITLLLASWRKGDERAFEKLFVLLYDDLRSIARSLLRRSRGDRTLTTTAVVHEAYVKLFEASRVNAGDRHHFLAIAAKVMRHLLVDAARRGAAAKRSPEGGRIVLDEATLPVESRPADILALHEALSRLESIDPRLGTLVELRFFGGLSVEETAAALEITDRTVRREWRKARAFLYSQLVEAGAP
jgi:RNA polymerase sigma factor (TIGR02999 family)